MAREKHKQCRLDLRAIQAGFPNAGMLCSSCATCPLLRHDGQRFHCAFVAGAPGKPVHPKIPPRKKRRKALLLADYSVHGAQIPAGEEVLLDRQQNAGTYCWVTVRNPGYGRLGKFLVNSKHLDLNGPTVKTAHAGRVEKIDRHAVLIAGIWYPLVETTVVGDDEKEIPAANLREGDQIKWIEIPEWLAQLKGLI